MSNRTRILERRAKFIAAALTLSCGGTVNDPKDASPDDAASVHDAHPSTDADLDANQSSDALVEVGPMPCLVPNK